MSAHPRPLTDEQERALRRTLGTPPAVEIVMVIATRRFVRMEGRHAMELRQTHLLPGGRAVRYGQDGRRLFVSDVVN